MYFETNRGGTLIYDVDFVIIINYSLFTKPLFLTEFSFHIFYYVFLRVGLKNVIVETGSVVSKIKWNEQTDKAKYYIDNLNLLHKTPISPHFVWQSTIAQNAQCS